MDLRIAAVILLLLVAYGGINLSRVCLSDGRRPCDDEWIAAAVQQAVIDRPEEVPAVLEPAPDVAGFLAANVGCCWVGLANQMAAEQMIDWIRRVSGRYAATVTIRPWVGGGITSSIGFGQGLEVRLDACGRMLGEGHVTTVIPAWMESEAPAG